LAESAQNAETEREATVSDAVTPPVPVSPVWVTVHPDPISATSGRR
jgi:hypothetical protein